MTTKSIKFVFGPHSADKDHTTMSGGTLNVDKQVISTEPISIFHYLLPGINITEVLAHPGIHTLEHMLAYSIDTGSLRSQISALTGNEEDAKSVLDISPFILENKDIGFRVSSVAPIDLSLLTSAYKKSLEVGEAYLTTGGTPPFATPRQCGQYDFHSVEGALIVIKSAQKQLISGVVAKEFMAPSSSSLEYAVCDLRLIKPKREGMHNDRMLDPGSSHAFSRALEAFTYKALPDGKPGDIRFGTFGCMTGDYVMIDNKYSMVQAHIAITRGLMTLDQFINDVTQLMLSDIAFCLKHIEDFSPEIYKQAQKLGPISFDKDARL